MRILVVRLSSLGDVVHAIPAVAAMRRAFPDARIDWLVDERYRELVDLVSVVDHGIDLPKARGASWLPRVARALRASRYDVAVDFQGLLKSAALARSAGAGRVIGFDPDHLRERWARWLYTETHPVGHPTHVIEKNLALVANLGVTAGTWEFPIDTRPSTAVGRTREALGLDPSEPFALLNPGSAWSSKCWAPDRFGALAQQLRTAHRLRSAVSWGPGEQDRADAVVAASAGAAAQVPPTSVADLVALSRAASVVVAGDTGPLHIAAAVETPIVGLYGPSDPLRNGPWDAADVVVSRFRHCSAGGRDPGRAGWLFVDASSRAHACRRSRSTRSSERWPVGSVGRTMLDLAGNPRLRRMFLVARARITVGFLIAAVAFWLARPSWRSLGYGALVAAGGETLRGLGSGPSPERPGGDSLRAVSSHATSSVLRVVSDRSRVRSRRGGLRRCRDGHRVSHDHAAGGDSPRRGHASPGVR